MLREHTMGIGNNLMFPSKPMPMILCCQFHQIRKGIKNELSREYV